MLKKKLKDYLQYLTINDDTLNETDNKLFMIKPAMSLNSTADTLHIQTIDGSQEIRNRIRQLID